MPRPNFPQREHDILSFWEKEKIFEKTLAKDSPKGRFVFYDGPPTANGKPGIHHVEARAFKDCIPRFRTMQGYRVERKGGWDAHGLPVELEVEKRFGFSGKKDIEAFGIEKFNQVCKESVWTYLKDWQTLTRRMGFWVDLEHPYITYAPEYIESLWWVIQQVWNQGLLYQDNKVLPYCPRCGTGLSSHELALGYAEVQETSLFVKFRVTDTQGKNSKVKKNLFFVAWTTTPWTLPSNVALAVGKEILYTEFRAKGAEDYYIVAKDLLPAVLKDTGMEIDLSYVRDQAGKGLVGWRYEPLFPFLKEVL
jgi:isoleucyl-tRNA synthetase